MMPRWNPDNPTPSAAYSPAGSASVYFQTRTPTPSRRTGSHLASSVFSPGPPPRTVSGVGISRPRGNEGACETKQTSFEWPIRGVRELKTQLEAVEDQDDDTRHEALSNDGAHFDDLAYKLHIERSPDRNSLIPSIVRDDEEDDEPPANPEPTLSLMVIALWVKYSDLPADEVFERNVFIGLKPYEREGDRALGEPNWFWSATSLVGFSKRQEYYEVTIPALSTLLDMPEVGSRDAFSIRVVVKHTSEPGLPPMVHADQQYISRRVTRQAAGFLDSVRTGDVQFVCLEHAGAGTPDEDGGRKMVRRRVMYAHSELLVHSEYFKATLKGGFAESQSAVTTLFVDDAAFNTVYWVLRWLYTDEIMFSTTGSVRAVMAQVRIDKAAARKVLNVESWDYVPLEDDEDMDVRTVRSSSSVGTSGRRSPGGRSATSTASGPAEPRRPSITSRSTSGASAQTPTPRLPRPKSSSPSRGPSRPPRTTPATSPTALRVATGTRKPPPIPVSKTSPTHPPPGPTSPGSGSRSFAPARRSHAPCDPHKHPADPPPPPSPLAVFFLAHRYGLDELQFLAREALLRNLTPDTCVAALLATYEFGELHAAVMDYVSDNWAEVSASPELDRCYQEVSAGVWGEYHGGQVLLGLTRRLTGMTLS